MKDKERIWSALNTKDGWDVIREMFQQDSGPLREEDRNQIWEVLKEKDSELYAYLQNRFLQRPNRTGPLLENLRGCSFRIKPIMSTKRVENPSIGGPWSYDLLTTNYTDISLEAISKPKILSFEEAVELVFKLNSIAAIISDQTLFHGKYTEKIHRKLNNRRETKCMQ